MKKIEFQNLPSTDTPITAENLNLMQSNVEEVFNGDEPMGSIVVEDIKSKNLLDKDGGFTNAWIDGEGNLIEGIYDCVFNQWIEIEGNTKYTLSVTEAVRNYGIVYYDANKILINRQQIDNGLVNTITTPSNAKYLRLSINYDGATKMTQSIIDELKPQLEKGSVATEYTSFKKFGYNSQESMGEIVVDDISCKNLLNKDGGFVGAYYTSAGEYITSSENATFNQVIEITGDTQYTYNVTEAVNNFTFVFFDENDNFIIRSKQTNTTGTATSPSNAKYLRICLNYNNVKMTQSIINTLRPYIVKGSVLLPYTPFKHFNYANHNSMGKIVVDDIECKNKLDWLGLLSKLNVTLPYTFTNNGVTFTIQTDGGIKVKGTSTNTIQYWLRGGYNDTTTLATLTNLHNVVASGGHDNWSDGLQVIFSSYDGNTRKNIIFSNRRWNIDNYNITGIQFAINSGVTVDETIYLQIENGDIPTNYVPFKKYGFEDTGWITLELINGATNITDDRKLSYRKIGNIVYLSGAIIPPASASNSAITIAYLPVGFRPHYKYESFMLRNDTGHCIAGVNFNEIDGAIWIQNATADETSFTNVSFVADN